MFWREKELFRFHLRVIVVLVFAALLCQSEDHQKASDTEIKSCSNAASASMKKDNFGDVVKDREQFILNLLDCTKETHRLILNAPETADCKPFDEMIPSEVLVSVMNTKIPEAIKTRSFDTENQRLILLSVYLVHISHRIRCFSCSAVNVWSQPVFILKPQLKKSVERLHFEFEQYILAFLDSTLMAQWKSDNTTILQNNGETLINMLNNFSAILNNLLEELSSYTRLDYPAKDTRSWLFDTLGGNVARPDEIKREMLASETELAIMKTLIKPYDGFLSYIFQSIIDISTKWNMLLMLFVLFSLGFHLVLYTRS